MPNRQTKPTNTKAPDDGWRYHRKQIEQFKDVNKLCKIASCWIYIGIKNIPITQCPCQYYTKHKTLKFKANNYNEYVFPQNTRINPHSELWT